MSFNIPNVFVAGKKAVAYDVNENFGAVKDEINLQKSSIAELTQNYNTIDSYVREGLEEKLTNMIKSSRAIFCVNEGNLNIEGKGDLLAIDTINDNRIVFKVSDGSIGNLAPVTYSNINGERATRTNFNAINMEGKEDGVYIVYAKLEGSPYVLKGKLYKSKEEPEMEAGDVWLNTSAIPLKAIKFNGVSYTNFEDVPIGEAFVEDGILVGVKTYSFNDNGYDINSGCKIDSKSTFAESIFEASIPNYSERTNITLNTEHTAESNGYIYIKANSSGSRATVTIENFTFDFSSNSDSRIFPIAKEMKYTITNVTNAYFMPHL